MMGVNGVINQLRNRKMKYCETCKHYEVYDCENTRIVGTCDNEKIAEDWGQPENDMLLYYQHVFFGPKFGCVHHKTKGD